MKDRSDRAEEHFMGLKYWVSKPSPKATGKAKEVKRMKEKLRTKVNSFIRRD